MFCRSQQVGIHFYTNSLARYYWQPQHEIVISFQKLSFAKHDEADDFFLYPSWFFIKNRVSRSRITARQIKNYAILVYIFMPKKGSYINTLFLYDKGW